MQNSGGPVDFHALLPPGDALLIVPPFASVEGPALGVHLLQAAAGAAGTRVGVLYANLTFAAGVGLENYQALGINLSLLSAFAGERLFARSAHGLPALGLESDRLFDPEVNSGPRMAALLNGTSPFSPVEAAPDLETLRIWEALAFEWTEAMATAIADLDYKVVGCTLTFGPVNATFALLKAVKQRRPEMITVVGGAGCFGELAEGLSSLDPARQVIDYIFSGESEESFSRFLQGVLAGQLPEGRVIGGAPCRDLDGLPQPDFRDYFTQQACFLPDLSADLIRLPYESSRGCWWAEAEGCHFCGLNGPDAVYRQKSSRRAYADLQGMAERYGRFHIRGTDRAMPRDYFDTLLPQLAVAPFALDLFLEQRTGINLAQVRAMRAAGIAKVEAGIESLSPSLLALMNKGVAARQNVMFMRYAQAVDLKVVWSLLWGFPGDQAAAYEEMLAWLPLIHHLPPPVVVTHLAFERFSDYLNRSDQFGLRDLHPLPAYADVFPAGSDLKRVAYYFMADYDCQSHQRLDLIRALMDETAAWRRHWAGEEGPRATLMLTPVGNHFLLLDSRRLPGTQPFQMLDREQARVAVTACPYVEGEALLAWAVEKKLGVCLEGWYVPLAIADPAVLAELEGEG